MTTIFHPTALNQASETAFYHALKLTLALNGNLNILHVSDKIDDVSFDAFPGIRDTLVQWGLAPEGAGKEVVGSLGIDVKKIIGNKGDPVSSSVNFLTKHPAEYVVLATRQKQDRIGILSGSVSEPIARKAGDARTLFIPHDADGFVSPVDGSLHLKHILLPVGPKPHPQPAIDVVASLIDTLGIMDQVEITLLYVGEIGEAPSVRVPGEGKWVQRTEAPSGYVGDTIVDFTTQNQVDLVVMPTDGPDGFLDALRGSNTERVMRGINCPLLAIPVRN